MICILSCEHVCACVLEGIFHYWLTCIVQIFHGHFKATVTIGLGMVRKCVTVGCVLVNVFRTGVKNVLSGRTEMVRLELVICCRELSTVEIGIFTQMNALCHVAQMDVK